MNEFNLYIDETCHLENDKVPVMCIGYIKINRTQYNELSQGIKEIKLRHNSPTELKWNKLSASRIALYKALVDYFFESQMTFRAILIKNKGLVDNQTYNENDHNIFYYKTAFYLLRNSISTNAVYRVYFDIKDSRGQKRLDKLSSVLERVYGKERFVHFQNIRSHENEFIQLCDLFIGAIGYKSRDDKPKNSVVKNEIIEYIETKLGYHLNEGTPPWENKFNIFDFQLRR